MKISPSTTVNLTLTQAYSIVITILLGSGVFYNWSNNKKESIALAHEIIKQKQEKDSIQDLKISAIDNQFMLNNIYHDSIKIYFRELKKMSQATSNTVEITKENVIRIAVKLNDLDILKSYINSQAFAQPDTVKKNFQLARYLN